MSGVTGGTGLSEPFVHLLCGLSGVGKTTYARRLAARLPAVWFGLDAWMLRLYPYRYDTSEYAERAEVCRELIWETALQVLHTGSDVVLDWNQWSRARRAHRHARAAEAGFAAWVHHLRVPVETAVARATARAARASPRRMCSTRLPCGILRRSSSRRPLMKGYQ